MSLPVTISCRVIFNFDSVSAANEALAYFKRRDAVNEFIAVRVEGATLIWSNHTPGLRNAVLPTSDAIMSILDYINSKC